jgi:hypothetical protein
VFYLIGMRSNESKMIAHKLSGVNHLASGAASNFLYKTKIDSDLKDRGIARR